MLAMPAAGLVVSPSAIAKYGTAVGEQQGQLQRIHDTLSSARVPSGAFGKLPEADDLYRAYTEHADEVLDITGQLPGHISNVAEGLLDTARSYSELEAAMAQGIMETFMPVDFGGSGGYTYSAPSDSAGRIVGGLGNVVNDGYQAYGWMTAPETGLPALVVKSVDPASGGITGGIQEAVDWVMEHLPLLTKLLDDVTGDTQALKKAAATWHGMGAQMNVVIGEIKEGARELPEAWAGEASVSFGTFMGNVAKALGILVSTMGQTQRILEDAAAEADFAFQTISMIVTEVVEWVAGNILVDVATAGLATGVEALADAAFIADKIREAEQAESKLADVLRALRKVLKSLKDIERLDRKYDALKDAEGGLDKARKFLALGKTFRDGLKFGKLANLRVFGDGKLASVTKFAIDAGRHGPNAKEVKEVADIGRFGIGTRIGTNVVVSAGEALTGLPVSTGGAGLAKDLVKGTLNDLQDNGQGTADTAGLEPSEKSETRKRIDAMLNPPQEPREER